MTRTRTPLLPLGLAVVLLTACGAPTPRAQEPAALAFRNVTVIDGTGAPAQSGTTVVVRETRITAVGPNVAIPAGAQVVDGTGKFMIPGLWDMHIHIHRWDEFVVLLANGVTGVRLMAGLPEYFTMVKQIESGAVLGPRIAMASRNMDGLMRDQPLPPPPGDKAGEAEEWQAVERGESIPRAFQVTNAEQAREAMALTKASGVEFIKIHNGLTQDAYLALAEEARKQGLYLTGHVPTGMSLADLSASGMRSIEHFGSGFLEGCSTREKALLKASLDALSLPPPQRARSAEAAQRTALESFSPDRCAELAALFVRNNTWLSPTFMPAGGMKAERDRSAHLAKYIPAQLRASWEKAASGAREPAAPTPEQRELAAAVEAKQREIVGIMKNAGVPFVIGTDTGRPWRVTGFNMHDALEETNRMGLTPMEVLQAATSSSTRLLRREADIGTVQQGKLADLVLLDADPLQQIANTRKINSVVVNGRLLNRQALDDMLAKLVEANAR
jgi:hypothetical protein